MTVLVDGRRIGYDETSGVGTPLVLVHGFPLDRSMWDDVMPALAGRRVIRVDLRGCGESEDSDGPALMEALAGDVAGVLDALDVPRAAIAGHSVGGYVALAFFRMYEERVAGLGLVASHTRADDGLAAWREAMAARLEREGTMDAAVEAYLPHYLAPQNAQERPELTERLRALMARQHPAGCAQLQRGMQLRVAADDLLEDIAVPALIVAGAHDHYISTSSLRETAAALRDAQYVAIERAGHLPPWEAPRETGDALASWLERVR